MRTKGLFYFRLQQAELVARLPSGLQFLVPALQPYGPGITRANADVTPSQLAAVIEWGRTRVSSSTVLRIARLDNRYERQELGDGHAELFRDPQYEPPQVLNLTSAFEARWSCTNCSRVDMSQIGALEVEDINPDVDLQLTETYEVLLASRFRAVAERAGARVRPLSSRQEFVQLLAIPTVTFVPVFPVCPIDEACPGCGRISYDRSDYVEGGLFTEGDTGLTVAQQWPLTLELGTGFNARHLSDVLSALDDDEVVLELGGQRGPRSPADPEAVGSSRERLGWRGTVAAERRHVVGQPVDMVEERVWESGETVVVVRLTLLDALLLAGARIPALRPVVMAHKNGRGRRSQETPGV